MPRRVPGRAVFFPGGSGAVGKDSAPRGIKSCSESTLRTTRPHARRTQGSARGLNASEKVCNVVQHGLPFPRVVRREVP